MTLARADTFALSWNKSTNKFTSLLINRLRRQINLWAGYDVA